MSSMFETLRVELGPEVHITIVTPGYIESEMNKGKYLSTEGRMTVDQEMRDVSYLYLTLSYNIFMNKYCVPLVKSSIYFCILFG